MQVTKITRSFGATVPTGQFANIREDITLEAILSENDDPDICGRQLAAQAKLLVSESVRETMSKRVAPVAELLAKLPAYQRDEFMGLLGGILWLRQVFPDAFQPSTTLTDLVEHSISMAEAVNGA